MRMRMPLHPRAWIDALLTYPRFLGSIKPELMGAPADQIELALKLSCRGWWPKSLDVPVATRILAISPHPDDETIGCGGFLSLHAGRSEIQIVSVYNGESGGALEEGPWRSDAQYMQRLVKARSAELDSVAQAIKASVVTRLGVGECAGTPGRNEVIALRGVLEHFRPEIVLLPWFLDNHPHHRATNKLFAEAAQGIRTMVLGYEIWELLVPNAFLDITRVLEDKIELVRKFPTQLRTVDYEGYVLALARSRAFHYPVRDRRDGAVEAYLALPCSDYCDLVRLV
jgi:N-acetylglucosamine malate deacetylase 1